MTVYAGQFGPEALEFPDGSHAITHPIYIKTLGGNLVSLYADRHRVDSLPNPVFTDSLGNLGFHAEPGKYKIEIGSWSLTISVPEDPAEPDTSLTPEEREQLAEDIEAEVLEAIEPPVTLTLLFENALA